MGGKADQEEFPLPCHAFEGLGLCLCLAFLALRLSQSECGQAVAVTVNSPQEVRWGREPGWVVCGLMNCPGLASAGGGVVGDG